MRYAMLSEGIIVRVFAHIIEKKGHDQPAQFLLYQSISDFLSITEARNVDYVGENYRFVWKDKECPLAVYKDGAPEAIGYEWMRYPTGIDFISTTNRNLIQLLKR